MNHIITVNVDGQEYIAMPAAEYRKLRGEQDGIAWAREHLGARLRQAREQAELSQAQLAKRLRRSQTLVARAERGEMRVSERYVKAVLQACKLPRNWPIKAA